eukprot:CAMPEP_0118937526 /NCGR_PEP_ID=MMETSP1169-20130426/23034_1 /TAXON_ID=36882 /ORGANISM="Pyramimonas obovata, Strain CCMP722" /LENGTH=279 /DNA_ID=CAMNT_0006881185 /DNA_START=139 /DNA_END=978 /DNA_ORIENTATION=-
MRCTGIVVLAVAILLTFPQHVVPAEDPKAETSAEGDDTKPAEDSGHASSHVVCNVTGPCVPCSTAEKEEDWSVCENTGHRQPITCLLLPANSQEQPQEQQENLQQDSAQEEAAPATAAAARKSRKGRRKLFEAEAAEPTNQDDTTLDDSKEASLLPDQTEIKVDAVVEDLAESGKEEEEEQEVPVPAALLRDNGEEKHTRLHKIAALIPGSWRRRLFFDAKTRKTERRFETFQSCSLESAKGSNESISVLVFEGVMLGLLAVSVPVVYTRRNQGMVRRV